MIDLSPLQQKQLDVLIAVDKVCRKKGIKYFLAYGTAIGAVRHGGYIPWDDDIDIIMLREDYNKFINECQKELPENIFIQTYESDKEYNLPFAKVRDSATTCMEVDAKDLDINHGVFIDVFPYDFIPDSNLKRNKQKICAGIGWMILRKDANKSSKMKAMVTKILTAFIPASKEKVIVKKLEKAVSKYKSNESSKVANMGFGLGLAHRLFDKDIFVDENINFEGYTLSIMKEYDKYLTQVYGDYMQLPPEEDRVGVHPFVVVDVDRSYKEVLKK